MDTLHIRAAALPSVLPGGSPESADHRLAPELHPRYCPIGLLADFALLMAGHGRCVHTAMMLGDREYALWQLASASALGDPELAAVAKRLLAYFDDPKQSALPVMGTA